ncbi:MAG TPA: Crp/Fnr family transcriptional regulator [Acidimicrobiales bacterium]|nr:Crp/Fnr family transcriptional regulator [Acidimicrobiales bacterium]
MGGLPQAELDALLAAGRTRRHLRGEVLLREGDAATSVLLIVSGLVKLTKTAASGRQAVLELRGPGDPVGELGAIDKQPRSANVVAVGDVEVVVLSAHRFDALVQKRSALAHRLLVTVVGRLREASARQLELGTVDVVARVCRRLAELAALGTSIDGGVLVRAELSQQDLADWAGISRDGVVRALHELRTLGWLETGRRRLMIQDLDAIRRRGHG